MRELFAALGMALFSILGGFVTRAHEKGQGSGRVMPLVTCLATALFTGLLVFFAFYGWAGVGFYPSMAIAGASGVGGYKGAQRICNHVLKRAGVVGKGDGEGEE